MQAHDNKDLDGDIADIHPKHGFVNKEGAPITLEVLREIITTPPPTSQPVKHHKSNYTMAERKEWKKKQKKTKNARKQAAKSRKINRRK